MTLRAIQFIATVVATTFAIGAYGSGEISEVKHPELFAPFHKTDTLNEIHDPKEILKLLDSHYESYTFDVAFKTGDVANYYSNYCRNIEKDFLCTFEKETVTVVSVDEEKAEIESTFEGFDEVRKFTVTKEMFENQKNFLRYYVESIGVSPPGDIYLDEASATTTRLDDGQYYTGYLVDFTIVPKDRVPLKAQMYLSATVPAIARVALLRHPATVFADARLRGYKEQARGFSLK